MIGLFGRNRRPEPEIRSVSAETIESSQWTLSDCPQTMDPAQSGALAELALRTGGRNIFFEAEFQSAAAGRIGSAGRRLLMLTENLGDEARLRLALPFAEERVGYPPVAVQRVFSHPFAPLSLPLVDETDADETLARFAALLPALGLRIPLVFEDFPVDDDIGALLLETLQGNGFGIECLQPRWRARLVPQDAANGALMSSSRRRRIARLERRLRETGHVEFERAERLWDILLRFEEFLVLETRGWKGRKGSSIHVIRKTAAFARQAVAELGAQGRAVIYTLRVDGNAIASLIMLRSANRYYPWKIAFDEAWRAYSPGTQLMLRATRQLLATPDFGFSDSLARETSWIDTLWPQKQQFATVIVTPPGIESRRAALSLVRLENARNLARRIISRRIAPPRPPSAPDREKSGE
jgi:CelD/BcsL family acetyltransferase involved in cellulose biosynthesis